MPKRRDTEYRRAVAEAERESRFFVAAEVKATVPVYRVETDRCTAELQLAWRDMAAEEKQALIKDTICKAKGFMRPVIPRPEMPAGRDIDFDASERERQLDAAYRAMTVEERAKFDDKMGARL